MNELQTYLRCKGILIEMVMVVGFSTFKVVKIKKNVFSEIHDDLPEGYPEILYEFDTWHWIKVRINNLGLAYLH